MTDLRLLDLFSGIGGFSYAAERLVGGYKTVGFCEIDPFCKQILNKHWPDVEVFKDVRQTDDFVRCGRVDIITGGYPCQPFSLAGKQKGSEDDRHLWPAMFELIKQKRPTWVVGENVAGHITLGLDEVLFDLESEGYAARPFVVPACAVDAPHRRDRVWIVAHANRDGEPDVSVDAESGCRKLGNEHVGDTDSQQRGATKKHRGLDLDRAVLDRRKGREEANTPQGSSGNVADAGYERLHERWQYSNVGKDGHGQGRMECNGEQSWAQTKGEDLANADSAQPQRGRVSSRIHAQHTDTDRRSDSSRWKAPQFWLPEPSVGRVAHGVSRRVDRLKSLGNSIVPQVAAQILHAIRAEHDV